MNLVYAFFLTILSETGWLMYIRGVARRRLALALFGNAAILLSGALAVRVIVEDPAVVPAVVAGGLVATALFWKERERKPR